MSQPQPVGESAALSRELADFLIELSIALHKNAIYPKGHPLLNGAVDGVTRRLGLLLQERPELSLGVAHHQLVIEGVVTDSNNPLLKELAQRIHRHHLGAVKFFKGLEREEVADFLKTVSVDADRKELPLGLGPAEELRRWRHVRLYPLSYDQLELLGEDEQRAPEGEAGARGAQLWVGLARAALMAEASSQASAESPPSTDPVVVAKAIDENNREVAYDQVIVGYLLQIADELKRKGGAEAAGLQRRISRLVGALRPETLRRLLTMGGDHAQRRRFVLDATQGMAVDAVMELVQAAAETSNQTISHSMVRLLSKLAAHAEQGAAPEVRSGADAALREHVQHLIGGWTLDDPNPGNYRVVLDHIARAAPMFSITDSTNSCEPERLVQMSIEMDSLGEPVIRAVDDMLKRNEVRQLLDVLGSAPDGSRSLDMLWSRLARPEQLRSLLREEPVDFPLVERLVKRMKLAAADPLLDELVAASSRATRRKLLDLLIELSSDVGQLIVERLPDERWYVVRNMLFLLNELRTSPPGFTPEPYTHHSDPRVRREASRLQLAAPATREQAICSALLDSDAQIVRAALATAREACPLAAVPIITRRISDRTLEPDLRLLGIRVIASANSANVLDWLLAIVVESKRLFGGTRLAAKSPEMLAALAGLAAHWESNPRVAPVLALARKHRDGEIRGVVPALAAAR